VSLVIENSAVLAWIYADETTEAVRQVFEVVAEDGALVPALWRLEVANSLTVAVRRSRIKAEFRNAALADLALLDIRTDPHTDAYRWTTTMHFADRFKLTVYDAAYLELAHRRSLPLASLDEELRASGRALGIPLLGLAA
jgi:predicted nucleic acid-binding protein